MAIRWGIVSAGNISHDFVTALNILPNEHEVVAVAARSLESAKAFAQQHKIKNAYGSYEDLAKDTDVDVVYIGNLNPHHFPVAKMMLENEKHVLCEKPLCMNLQQTQKLIKCARDSKRFLMEAIWSRFFPVYEQIRKELKEENLGKPQIVQANFGIPISHVERVHSAALGGSSALDIGIYTVQFACLAFGAEKPLKISASGFLNKEGVDEIVSVTLLYKNNRMAVLTFSATSKLPNEALIACSDGIIKVSEPFWCPTQLTVSSQKHDFKLPSSAGKFNYPNSSGLLYEAIEVRKCIQTGLLESPFLPLSESELISSILTEIHTQLGVTFPPEAIL